MLRTQIGFLPEHPIRIHYGQCNTLVEGTLSQDEAK